MSHHFTPGEETLLTSTSPSTSFRATFEDDGDTAYFYAIDSARHQNTILDAVHIYDASQLPTGAAFLAQIVWSPDGMKAGLFLDGQLHALLDFSTSHAYCRTNFPPPSAPWVRPRWHDQLSALLS